MNAEVFATWLRRQGYRVLRTPSSYWYEQGPRVYQAFPFHWLIRPAQGELSSLLRQHWALGLRYSSPPDEPSGKLSYHIVYEGDDYRLEDLGSHARRNVRHGLKNCTVEAISFERLAEEGWESLADTCDRQQRGLPMTCEAWRARCLAAADLPGFDAWGAIVDGRVVATLLACQIDDCYELISQQCLREYMPLHVNNALCYEVTQRALSRASVRSIFYTLESLDAAPSVDLFKTRMGYTARPVRQRVVFHPWLALLVGAPSHAVVRGLSARWPEHPTLAKAEGMLRFYLEGKRAVAEQSLPEALEGLQAEPTTVFGPSPKPG